MEVADALRIEASSIDEMAEPQSKVKQDEARLQRFREWLRVNGVQSRCCDVSPRSNGDGFGLFATQDTARGVLMVTPLYLAITPMTVLQDPELGGFYGKLMQGAEEGEGEVDDRMLMLLFLLIERARGQSSFWAPYLDIMPSKFGTPLCYSEEELLELKGTHLFQATHQQRRSLKSAFDHRVKKFAEEALLFVESERR